MEHKVVYHTSVPFEARTVDTITLKGRTERMAPGERARLAAKGLMYCRKCDMVYTIAGEGGSHNYCKACNRKGGDRHAGVRAARDWKADYQRRKEYHRKYREGATERLRTERERLRAEREREEYIQRTLKARAYDQPAEVLARLDAERDEGLRD